jgi:CheY-like chemotaxis protein
LVGGVAHDFNNLLTVVLSHADLIETDPDAKQEHREDARQIREAGECAASLTRQLLSFGRQQPSLPEVLDLNSTVRTMEKMLRRLIGENIDLVVRLAPDLGRIEADPSQIEQVILNLAVNARDAMPHGGRLTIETTNDATNTDACEALVPPQPDQYVVLTVTDSGAGMDEQTRARAFDPFFTTKAPGKGTGLGLATVHAIVEQGKGHIRIDSTPGKGTAFTVYWPSENHGRAPAKKLIEGDAASGRGETIMLVKGEGVVRRLARRMLMQAGYRVLDAASGEDALQQAEQLHEPIDLLVTDLVLPNMHGRELAERMCSQQPSLRVLFTSGYAESLDPQGVLGRPISLVAKPFTIRGLADAVRAALDAGMPQRGPPLPAPLRR